jgi:CheY-like chemotaxis protein
MPPEGLGGGIADVLKPQGNSPTDCQLRPGERIFAYRHLVGASARGYRTGAALQRRLIETILRLAKPIALKPAAPMDVSSPSPKPLSDLKVLVVEDDYLQATVCAMTLEESGANVLGPVSDVTDARDIVDMIPPDCVVLDLRLRDDFAFLLADELRKRGIPTILATGYDTSVFPFNPALKECLLKPFSDTQLINAVLTAVNQSPQGLPAH